MNDWRFFRHRPRKAHLWEPTPSGMWRSKCGYVVVQIFEATHPLTNDEQIPKCQLCIQHEVRRSDVSSEPMSIKSNRKSHGHRRP